MKEFNKEILRKFLESCKNFCILCIGNPLRGDDSIGIGIGKILERYFKNVFVAETDPTAYFSKLREFDGIIIIDSAKMGCDPGEIRILEKEELKDFLYTTHDIPLRVLLDMLKDKRVLIIGIEPKNTKFGEGISEEVKEASKIILNNFLDILENY